MSNKRHDMGSLPGSEADEIKSILGPGGVPIRIRRDVLDSLSGDVARILLDPQALGASVIKENPKRSVFHLETPAGPLIIKHHRDTGVKERVRGLVAGKRARREWDIANAMIEKGLPAPVPVARMEEEVKADDGTGRLSVYAMRAVSGAVPLGTYLEERFRPGDGLRDEKRKWLGRAVELLSRLHRAGFDHRDYHGGNILVEQESGDGSAGELVVVDLHRVVTTSSVSTTRRVRALADLLHTLRFAIDLEDTDFAVGVFLEASEDKSFDRGRFTASVRKAWDRREARRVRSRTKRCVRESSKFTAVHTGGVSGFRVKAVEEEDLFGAVAHARKMIADGLSGVRSLGRRSSVAVAACGDRRVAIKVYPGDGTRSLRGKMTRGRAGKAYRSAHGLAVRGVSVPAVVAWLRTPDRSILVVDEIHEAEPLSVLSFKILKGGELEGRGTLVADAVAELLVAFFRSGVTGNDLSPKNILLRMDGEQVSAYLCDFDGIMLGRTPSRTRIVRGLAQVNDLAPEVSIRLRLRVLKRLREVLPGLSGKAIVREIASLTRARSDKTLATPCTESVGGRP